MNIMAAVVIVIIMIIQVGQLKNDAIATLISHHSFNN